MIAAYTVTSVQSSVKTAVSANIVQMFVENVSAALYAANRQL